MEDVLDIGFPGEAGEGEKGRENGTKGSAWGVNCESEA